MNLLIIGYVTESTTCHKIRLTLADQLNIDIALLFMIGGGNVHAMQFCAANSYIVHPMYILGINDTPSY